MAHRLGTRRGDRDDPEQLRDNGHVQSRNGKKMQRPGLLKLFLDFIRRVVAHSEHHPADQSMDSGRIFQPARQRRLHPMARDSLRGAQDWVAAGMAQDASILRISHDEHMVNVLPREIRAHVEFARIARTAAMRSGDAEKRISIAEAPPRRASARTVSHSSQACVPHASIESSFGSERRPSPRAEIFGSLTTDPQHGHRLRVRCRGRGRAARPAECVCAHAVEQEEAALTKAGEPQTNLPPVSAITAQNHEPPRPAGELLGAKSRGHGDPGNTRDSQCDERLARPCT